jgi:hypothetical protein
MDLPRVVQEAKNRRFLLAIGKKLDKLTLFTALTV